MDSLLSSSLQKKWVSEDLLTTKILPSSTLTEGKIGKPILSWVSETMQNYPFATIEELSYSFEKKNLSSQSDFLSLPIEWKLTIKDIKGKIKSFSSQKQNFKFYTNQAGEQEDASFAFFHLLGWMIQKNILFLFHKNKLKEEPRSSFIQTIFSETTGRHLNTYQISSLIFQDMSVINEKAPFSFTVIKAAQTFSDVIQPLEALEPIWLEKQLLSIPILSQDEKNQLDFVLTSNQKLIHLLKNLSSKLSKEEKKNYWDQFLLQLFQNLRFKISLEKKELSNLFLYPNFYRSFQTIQENYEEKKPTSLFYTEIERTCYLSFDVEDLKKYLVSFETLRMSFQNKGYGEENVEGLPENVETKFAAQTRLLSNLEKDFERAKKEFSEIETKIKQIQKNLPSLLQRLFFDFFDKEFDQFKSNLKNWEEPIKKQIKIVTINLETLKTCKKHFPSESDHLGDK